MIFGDSKDIKPLYFIPTDDLVGEVLVPAFAEAGRGGSFGVDSDIVGGSEVVLDFEVSLRF